MTANLPASTPIRKQQIKSEGAGFQLFLGLLHQLKAGLDGFSLLAEWQIQQILNDALTAGTYQNMAAYQSATQMAVHLGDADFDP